MFEKLFGKKKESAAPVQEAVYEPSDMAKSMMERFSFPYRVFPEGTPYSAIMDEYDRKFEEGKSAGYIPMLVPVDDVLEEFWTSILEEDYNADEVISNASSEAGKEYLDKRYKEYREDSGESEDTFIGSFDGPGQEIYEYTAICKLRSNETVETIMVDVPVTEAWQAIARLPFGGWNECPGAHDMANICKYWFEKWGAVPVTISHDVMEMHVRGMISDEDALMLAKEHYAFTPDRVDQCTATYTLSEVAKCIQESSVWYFWWD